MNSSCCCGLQVLALHSLQHMLVTRRLIQRHQRSEKTESKMNDSPERDQGFTRCTVLVLLPFRAHALAFMKSLFALLPPNIEQAHNPGTLPENTKPALHPIVSI